MVQLLNTHHFNFTVADMDRSLRFWRDALGLEVLNDWISVDFGDTVGRVSPRLYGVGFEHLGAAVYGGFWTGAEANTTVGWRDDVLQLARQLRPGLLRWPGGNFAQHYHWRDGIGPRESR